MKEYNGIASLLKSNTHSLYLVESVVSELIMRRSAMKKNVLLKNVFPFILMFILVFSVNNIGNAVGVSLMM